MIRRVKKAFVDNLPNLDWMDNKTRTAAVGKVSVVIDVIIVLHYMTQFHESVCLSICLCMCLPVSLSAPMSYC